MFAIGTSMGTSSFRPERTQPCQNPVLAGLPGGARTRTSFGREASGPGSPREQGRPVRPRETACVRGGLHLRASPWKRVWPQSQLVREGAARPPPRTPWGRGEASEAHRDAEAATLGSSVASARSRPRVSPPRHPFPPPPPPASPATPLGRSLSSCPSAPVRRGVGLRLWEAGDLNLAAWRVRKPRFPRRLRPGVRLHSSLAVA